MKVFTKLSLIVLVLNTFFSCNKNNDEIIIPIRDQKPQSIFYKGMDLSFQMEYENLNLDYKDIDNNVINILDFSKQKGCNLVRLKLWHEPTNEQNTLSKIKMYALKLKQKNISFLLDIHYSDSWADPNNQMPPMAWQNLTQIQIENKVYSYTKDVILQLKNQGTSPEFVQIGNETDSGFLWNYGKVWNQYSNNWANYVNLVKKGIQAVREVNGTNTKIILHHSSVLNANYFFDQLVVYNIDFDVIGLSYYPQYSTKDLNIVQNKLNYLAATFNKKIMIVEVAYPFTFGFVDNSNNIIGDASQIIPNFPATPIGQKDFLVEINNIVNNIPDHKGIGWVYWAPDWIAFSGNQTTSTQGSAWENQCLFDFNHKALPAFEAFTP